MEGPAQRDFFPPTSDTSCSKDSLIRRTESGDKEKEREKKKVGSQRETSEISFALKFNAEDWITGCRN